MYGLLNFGEKPFLLLFVLVAGIFVMTVAANMVSLVLTAAINARTRRLVRRYRRAT